MYLPDGLSRHSETAGDRLRFCPVARQPGAAAGRVRLRFVRLRSPLGFPRRVAQYYATNPELFRNYIREPGQWMPFTRLSDVDNANEFCFALQEGSPEPEYDNRLGVLSTTYFIADGMGANAPHYDPERDPLPPYAVQVEAMDAAFRLATGIHGCFTKSACTMPPGSWTCASGKPIARDGPLQPRSATPVRPLGLTSRPANRRRDSGAAEPASMASTTTVFRRTSTIGPIISVRPTFPVSGTR